MCASRLYTAYILASRRNGTLYTGITGDLCVRMLQHTEKRTDGFTKKYDVTMLVYYELWGSAAHAIMRETRIKRWNRAWKIRLIEKHNPEWIDLWNGGELLPLPVPQDA